jgi:hypothetical protein
MCFFNGNSGCFFWVNDDIPNEMTVAGQDDSTKSGLDTTGSVADLFSKRKYIAIYRI